MSFPIQNGDSHYSWLMMSGIIAIEDGSRSFDFVSHENMLIFHIFHIVVCKRLPEGCFDWESSYTSCELIGNLSPYVVGNILGYSNLVGGLEHVSFSHILEVIILID